MHDALLWLALTFAIPVVGIGGQRLKWWIEDRRWRRSVDKLFDYLESQ
jgi:hypothetical protein